MKETAKTEWLLWMGKQLEDEDLIHDLHEMEQHPAHMQQCFGEPLKFGTGGIREIMGAGTRRMNIYTVRKATQGYANYLKQLHGRFVHVAIAYDTRNRSSLFAKTAAEVFAANDIQVSIYEAPTPTPLLSFAIRALSCHGGIVITASHNSAEYNGYKVYDETGCQIVPDIAKDIEKEINKLHIFESIRLSSFQKEKQLGKIRFIQPDIKEAYLQEVVKEGLQVACNIRNLSILYTPLHGAGLPFVKEALTSSGFTDLDFVKEQSMPDGDFPYAPVPNPELLEVYSMGIKQALQKDYDLILATDPDCDRAGVAVNRDGGYHVLTGNQIGILLFDYICRRRSENKTMPKNPLAVKSLTTTDFLYKIADRYHVRILEVLTGFKYIGAVIKELEAQGKMNDFILGVEESHGYLSGTYVRDKDGTNAALLICHMAAYYKQRGKNLLEALDDLYSTYGLVRDISFGCAFDEDDGKTKMKKTMEYLRGNPWISIGNRTVIRVRDYLPEADVIKMELEDGSTVIIRPSGTEPKLKIYIFLNGRDGNSADIKQQILNKLKGIGI